MPLSTVGSDMKFPATLSKRFQVTIPQAVRDAYGWRVGQKFVFSIEGDTAVMKPVPTLEELAGIASYAFGEGYRDRKDRH